MLQTLTSQADDLKIKISKVEGVKSQLVNQRSKLDLEIETLKQGAVVREKTVSLFKQLLDKLIDENVTTLSKLVTEGLKIVIPDQQVEFSATIEQKKDLWIRFTTIENGVEGDVINSFGGMIVALESFILRVLCILKLKLKRILILDEVFAHVSTEYLENTSYLIKKLCDDFGIDLLLVTHKKQLLKYADTVYYAKSENEKGLKRLVLEKGE